MNKHHLSVKRILLGFEHANYGQGPTTIDLFFYKESLTNFAHHTPLNR